MSANSADPIEQHLDGILRGENDAWSAEVLRQLVVCAENAVRIKYPNLGEGEFRELADEVIVSFYGLKGKTRVKFPTARYVRAYIKTAARNLAIDLLTKKTGKPRERGKNPNVVDWEDGQVTKATASVDSVKDKYTGNLVELEKIEPEDLGADPAVSNQIDNDRLTLLEALALINDRCRQILTMFYFDDLDKQTIGEKLNLGKSVVYDNFTKCENELRKACEKLDLSYGGAL